MSNLPGNPHVFEGPQIATPDTINEEIAEQGVTDMTVMLSELARNTESNYALAFEQRTANLIAWQALGRQLDETSEPTPEAEDDIAARLGLGDHDGGCDTERMRLPSPSSRGIRSSALPSAHDSQNKGNPNRYGQGQNNHPHK